VIDLQIAAGKVAAQVSGSDLYDVAIQIDVVASAAWRAIQRECAGGIASRIDLLAGTLSEPVMARLCADRTGLFPAPSAIQFSCSCPDYAAMCKHVAAVLYGIGARLDEQPDLLFALRKVDQKDLITRAGKGLPQTKGPKAEKVLDAGDLSEMFGIEIAQAAKPRTAAVRKPRALRVAPVAPAPTAPTPAKSAAKSAARSAVSTRMKEYWRDRRRRRDETPR